MNSAFGRKRFVGFEPSSHTPDFGRFFPLTGTGGLRAATAPCSPKTSLVAHATHGFTHGRVYRRVKDKCPLGTSISRVERTQVGRVSRQRLAAFLRTPIRPWHPLPPRQDACSARKAQAVASAGGSHTGGLLWPKTAQSRPRAPADLSPPDAPQTRSPLPSFHYTSRSRSLRSLDYGW